MRTYIRNIRESEFACSALILPIPEGKGAGCYKDIDKALNGLMRKVMASEEFSGKHNEVCLIHAEGKIKPDRILLIGLGNKKDITPEKLRQTGGKTASYLKTLNIRDAALSAESIRSLGLSYVDFIEGVMLANYDFTKYKKENTGKGISKITVLSDKVLNKEVRWVDKTTAAVHFARDLVNTPSNDMTPSALVRAARSLKNVRIKVIDRARAAELGMGAYLSVARGSVEPLKFIEIIYKGKKNIPPVALIGKSITFDSGGISLKPGQGMEKMKYDMAGGAAVLGAIKAASEINLPVHIVGILPAAENLPGGSASKPGDVVRTIGGKTIEIISTDAEGRLALADAIEYAKRFKPSAIIDIATLTGACAITFGSEVIAMMGNNQPIMEKLKKASAETAEKVWQMPLFDEYKDYIKSDIADLKNSGGRSGSLSSSGYFLKEFAGETPWVHLDIAGTAWIDKGRPYIPKGATGIGVRLLLSFLRLL